MSWSYGGRVVRLLQSARRAGIEDFDVAWGRVLEVAPAPGTWHNERLEGRLFSVELEPREPTALEFLREQCRAEWEGRPVVAVRLDSFEGFEALGFDLSAAAAPKGRRAARPLVRY